jgi:phosphate transport system substrate-binding protein
MKKISIIMLVALIGIVSFSMVGSAQDLEGSVKIDGSSTVYPITQAMAEEFSYVNSKVRVTVGVSGTGGGMEKFTIGETDISNASREIKDSELAKTKENGIAITRFTVAYDGITVVVNPENDWANDITVEELQKIWEPGSSVETWSDVRPEWPNEEIELYGPGADSGTFDYFTGAIVGNESESRADFTASEDDNVLVQGVAGSKYALGYFGYAYFEENQNKLKALTINGVKPTPENIESDKYTPLSRPLFIYVNDASVKRIEVEAFLNFYFENARELIPMVGYVPLTSYEDQLDKVEELANN